MRNLWLIVFFILSVNISVQGQIRKNKKKASYENYWQEEEKKEAFQKLFDEGKALFAAKHYEQAIEKLNECFSIYPDDPQTKAKIRDIEIVLASLPIESEEAPVERVFIPIEKLAIEQKEIALQTTVREAQPLNEKQIPEEKTIEKPATTEQAPKSSPDKVQKSPAVSQATIASKPTNKSNQDFRIELAKKFPEGFTEESFQKGSRFITKRVIVKDGIGDEYLRVKHSWGGLYYFKNGEPCSAFTWEKESNLKKD